ncbi:MAG: nucleoid-associated protein [Clostridium sp.]
MSIAFKNTIVHILDLSAGHHILSARNLLLEDEIEAFITKHINNLFENNEVSKATFKEDSDVLQTISPYSDEKFHEISCSLADKFFNYMTNYDLIPSGDLIVSSFERNGENFLAIIKLNYKEEFTHHIENNDLGGTAQIIKHKSIFSSKKIDEAVIINIDTFDVWLLDKSKEKYLPLLLDIENHLSVKEKLAVVEQITNEVIEQHFANPIEAITTLKSNIAESIFESSSVPITEVIKETFKEYEQVCEECMTKIEECGFKDETITLSNPKEAKKYSSHKLKTNTGIEIKLPTDMIQNPNFIEFINNPDGTISIMIKNVGQIINK